MYYFCFYLDRPCHIESDVRCADGAECIDKKFICDIWPDCRDKSDEGDMCLGSACCIC